MDSRRYHCPEREDVMDFTIRNLPDSVLDDLERAARLNGRSVNEEVISRLAPVASRSGESVEAELAEIDRVRGTLSVPPLTWEYLERAIEEGRP
jgi:plasmid stability protein